MRSESQKTEFAQTNSGWNHFVVEQKKILLRVGFEPTQR